MSDWKMKFSSSDIKLMQIMQGILSSIENDTIDKDAKAKVKRYRMQCHEVMIKMLSVNQDMHFAF
jgi:hypothetical protein